MTIDDSRSGAEQAACLVASYAPGTGLPAAMSYELLGRLAGEIAAAHGGQQVVRRTAGEVALVLPAVAGAVAAARALRAGGPGGSALGAMLRIAVHVGAPVRPGSPATSYDAPALRRCAHLSEIANPGQTVLSAAAAAAYSAATVAAGLPGELRDLGMHRLRDLGTAERVYALLSEPAARAPLRSLDTVPNNLPLQLTSFVGRYDERAAVRGLLTGNRLVTIAGSGGGGKTRLAAQVAAELADRWPDGVWWAELAAVTDPAQVSDAVAEAAGVLAELAGGQLRSLTAQLRDKRALVCLDNCEHVLDGAADVADALLRSCPEVTVLATSREPLDLPGEVVWRVPGLAEDDAVALFAERAGAVRAGFAVDEATEPVVRSLCGRLDGVPLALELAAAWLRTLTPAQIEAGLDDRFGLLVRGPRGAAERQRSLAASIDWSHELLDEPDRRVFARLAVFAGGFSLDAARAVCADGAGVVLGSLGRLVDKSLVVAEESGGAARYRLLETIREYAAARLAAEGATAAVRDRHLAYFAGLAEAAEVELEEDKDTWSARFEPERENLRAALDWGLAAEDPEPARRLAASLTWLWNLRATGQEGLAYLRRAIDRAADDRSLLQARLFTSYGLVADTAAPFDRTGAERGLELATELGDDRLRARCLVLSAVWRLYGDFDAAWDLCVEAEGASNDRFAIDGTLALRGVILAVRDRHDEARPLLAEAAEGFVRRGDRGIAATVLAARSSSALSTGHLVAARALAEQAVEQAEPLGDYHRVGSARGQLAVVLGRLGDLETGFDVMAPLLRLVGGPESDVSVPGLGRVMGDLYRWRGDADEAVRWLAKDTPVSGPAAETYLAALCLPAYGAALRAAGRDEDAAAALERAIALSRTFDLPGVRADALHQLGLLALGSPWEEPADPELAADLLQEALGLRLELGLRLSVLDSLDALSVLASASGRTVEAARLVAAADRGREELGCPRFPADRVMYDALTARLADVPAEAAVLTPEEAAAYIRRTRGTRGRPATGWASLTPTELDVVRLAVEGLNNPEIGARLYISRSTVKTHLAHVYAKLGVANRTELATVAGRRLTSG